MKDHVTSTLKVYQSMKNSHCREILAVRHALFTLEEEGNMIFHKATQHPSSNAVRTSNIPLKRPNIHAKKHSVTLQNAVVLILVTVWNSNYKISLFQQLWYSYAFLDLSGIWVW